LQLGSLKIALAKTFNCNFAPLKELSVRPFGIASPMFPREFTPDGNAFLKAREISSADFCA
jgi:hypothetical protein